MTGVRRSTFSVRRSAFGVRRQAGYFPAIRKLCGKSRTHPRSLPTCLGVPLGADDYVICADEKTSIQARRRKQPTLPLAPNRPTYVEHEYFRMGAWTYLAAWDVHRARVFGGCEVKD
jgi:hypothetical protein